MVKLVGAMMVVVGLMGAAWAADTMPTTKAATSKSALPACCGDTCKKMVSCCKEDSGKTTCAMGGSCCVKAESKPAATAPAHDMGGMNMGH